MKTIAKINDNVHTEAIISITAKIIRHIQNSHLGEQAWGKHEITYSMAATEVNYVIKCRKLP